MTFNALGTKMKGSDKTLAEFLGIDMSEFKAKELTVEEVYTDNLAEIRVKLSNAELVKTEDALYNPANYRLSGTDAKVRHVHLDGDEVVLTLVPYGKVLDQEKFEVLAKGKKFDLTIRNIHRDINKSYKNILAVDNTIPTIENVEFMGDYGIKVTTSEPIANPEERNFRLDSRTSMLVEQYGKDIILTPYHEGKFNKDAKELTIDLLNDFAGYTTIKTVEAMELSTDEGLPKVERAYRSGNKLVVTFDRDVYNDSVAAYESRRDLGNVSFVERRSPFYAKEAVKVDTNVVEYTFEREIPKGIEITIQDVANHFNKAMEKEEIVPDEYKDDWAPVVISTKHNPVITDKYEDILKGYSSSKLETELNKGFKADTKEITIIFDKDIAQIADKKITNANVRDYFNLYELDITKRGETAAEGVTIEVSYVKDDNKKDMNDRIKLSYKDIKVNNDDRDYDYILEVKNLHDLSGNRMDREYLDFQVVRPSNTFDVEIKDIETTRYFNRDGIEIVLGFNKPVNKEEASIAKNYYLDSKVDVDEAIVERDGKTVSLVVYDYKTVESFLKDYKVLEISPRVEALASPNPSVAHRFWDLKTKKAIEDKNIGSTSKVSGATASSIVVDDKTITPGLGTPLQKALAAMTTPADLNGAKIELSKDNSTLTRVELIDTNATTGKAPYTANFLDALVQNLEGVTIVGKGNDSTEKEATKVSGKVTVKAKDVTIENIEIAGDLEIALPYSTAKFTSKDNHITGNVIVTKGDASFNTKIDGNVTVAEDATANFKNVELSEDTTVKVNGEATFEDVEFNKDTKLVVEATGEVALVGKTGELKGNNIEVKLGGKLDVNKADEEADLEEGMDEAKEADEKLETAKTLAKAELVVYADGKEGVGAAVTAGKDAIDAAKTKAEVTEALNNAKAAIDEIVNAAEVKAANALIAAAKTRIDVTLKLDGKVLTNDLSEDLKAALEAKLADEEAITGIKLTVTKDTEDNIEGKNYTVIIADEAEKGTPENVAFTVTVE